MTNNIAERVFKTANVAEMIFVRAAYFMENWTMFTETLQGPEPFVPSVITPLDYKIPMIAVKDIGENLAMGLTSTYTPATKPYVFALEGPEHYTPFDVQTAFAKALQKDVALTPVEKDKLREFYGQFIPPHVLPLYEEMIVSFLPGGIMAMDSDKREVVHVVKGKTTLEEAIKGALSV